VFVDEAQHLSRVASERRLSDQLNIVKSIANRTASVKVLIRPYELSLPQSQRTTESTEHRRAPSALQIR
jgi:hypothetical protein